MDKGTTVPFRLESLVEFFGREGSQLTVQGTMRMRVALFYLGHWHALCVFIPLPVCACHLVFILLITDTFVISKKKK